MQPKRFKGAYPPSFLTKMRVEWKSLKGTQTERNILTAFAGESQARNRYDYFAGAAKKDGFVQIADIFTETALQEKEHAKRLFKFLEGGDVEITAALPCPASSRARKQTCTPPLPVNITNILKCIPLLRISPTLKVFPKSPA